MTDPIIIPAPVPPSIAGIPQPVFAGGSATVPPTPIPITGSPIIPPPTIGDPEGFPVFPPVDPDTAPVAVPVGPLVGPAVAYAAVPPSVAGFPQPQYSTGSGTVPTATSLFPAFTAAGANPPIIVVTSAPPPPIPLPLPTTPGIQPIVISPVPTIPQLPWNPTLPGPPVNTARPTVTGANLNVGTQLVSTTGTWTGTGGTITYTQQWERDGSPIAGASGVNYTLAPADVGAEITVNVTARDTNGEASMTSLPAGPVALPAPVNTAAPLATLNPTFILCTGGNWTPNPPMYTLSYQWYSPAGTLVAGATTSSWTFAGHEGDTAYCAVRASNSAGQSAPTNTNTVTIPAALAASEPSDGWGSVQ